MSTTSRVASHREAEQTFRTALAYLQTRGTNNTLTIAGRLQLIHTPASNTRPHQLDIISQFGKPETVMRVFWKDPDDPTILTWRPGAWKRLLQ